MALSKLGNVIEILVYVDDLLAVNIKTGIARIDVERLFPSVKNAYESGFIFTLDLSKYDVGKHTIKVVVRTLSTEKLIGSANCEFEKTHLFHLRSLT